MFTPHQDQGLSLIRDFLRFLTLLLGSWQGLMLVELDGPRSTRTIRPMARVLRARTCSYTLRH